MRLLDQVVIVTGGGSGIGRAYCERLVLEGAKVVVVDRDGPAVDEFAGVVNASTEDERALAVTADVTDESEVREVVACALNRFGHVDGLVNNVGLYPHQSFEDVSVDDWDRIMRVNVRSTFLCSQATLPTMRERGRGKIVNIATNLIWIGLPGMVPAGPEVVDHLVVGHPIQPCPERRPTVLVPGDGLPGLQEHLLCEVLRYLPVARAHEQVSQDLRLEAVVEGAEGLGIPFPGAVDERTDDPRFLIRRLCGAPSRFRLIQRNMPRSVRQSWRHRRCSGAVSALGTVTRKGKRIGGGAHAGMERCAAFAGNSLRA